MAIGAKASDVLTSPPSATDVLAHLIITAAVSISFILASASVTIISLPIQVRLGISHAEATLFSFPHGVRVLVAYLFGWRSIAYFLPIYLLYPPDIIAAEALPTKVAIAALAQAACVAAFYLLSLTRIIPANWEEIALPWRSLALAGGVAAALSAMIGGALYGHSNDVMAALFIGNILGFITVMALLLLGFHLIRRGA